MIAVVVLGLSGSATGKWSMSAPIVESGTFDVFWDTISFAVNGARRPQSALGTLQCLVKLIISVQHSMSTCRVARFTALPRRLSCCASGSVAHTRSQDEQPTGAGPH